MDAQEYITVTRANEIPGVILCGGRPYMSIGTRGERLPAVGPLDGPKIPCYAQARKLVPAKGFVRKVDGSLLPVPEGGADPVIRKLRTATQERGAPRPTL